jgi:hypothetical protein
VLEPFPEIGFGKSLSFFNGFFFSLPSKISTCLLNVRR